MEIRMKNLLFVSMMSLFFSLAVLVSETKAGIIYGHSDILYYSGPRSVYGISVTILDYEAGLYYDPAVLGELYRTDMNESPLDSWYNVGYADLINAQAVTFSSNYVEGKTYCEYGTHFTIDFDSGNRTLRGTTGKCVTIPFPPTP